MIFEAFFIYVCGNVFGWRSSFVCVCVFWRIRGSRDRKEGGCFLGGFLSIFLLWGSGNPQALLKQ